MSLKPIQPHATNHFTKVHLPAYQLARKYAERYDQHFGTGLLPKVGTDGRGYRGVLGTILLRVRVDEERGSVIAYNGCMTGARVSLTSL